MTEQKRMPGTTPPPVAGPAKATPLLVQADGPLEVETAAPVEVEIQPTNELHLVRFVLSPENPTGQLLPPDELRVRAVISLVQYGGDEFGQPPAVVRDGPSAFVFGPDPFGVELASMRRYPALTHGMEFTTTAPVYIAGALEVTSGGLGATGAFAAAIAAIERRTK